MADWSDETVEELICLMKANLREPGRAAAALPMVVSQSQAARMGLDLGVVADSKWAELEAEHPGVMATGILVVPDALWPDPTASTYSMGVFDV